jgi:prolipoprotein diacylglyceryltransferase
VIWAGRHLPIRKGYLFYVYAALYSVGRFFIEHLRVDEAHRYLGLRLNDWTSILIFVVSVAVLATRGRAGPGTSRVGDPVRPRPPPGPSSSSTTIQPTAT